MKAGGLSRGFSEGLVDEDLDADLLELGGARLGAAARLVRVAGRGDHEVALVELDPGLAGRVDVEAEVVLAVELAEGLELADRRRR